MQCTGPIRCTESIHIWWFHRQILFAIHITSWNKICIEESLKGTFFLLAATPAACFENTPFASRHRYAMAGALIIPPLSSYIYFILPQFLRIPLCYFSPAPCFMMAIEIGRRNSVKQYSFLYAWLAAFYSPLSLRCYFLLLRGLMLAILEWYLLWSIRHPFHDFNASAHRPKRYLSPFSFFSMPLPATAQLELVHFTGIVAMMHIDASMAPLSKRSTLLVACEWQHITWSAGICHYSLCKSFDAASGQPCRLRACSGAAGHCWRLWARH